MRQRHVAVAVVALLSFVGLSGGDARLAKGETIAYWRFEEGAANTAASGANTILDSSGHGLNGTPINGPIYRASVWASPIPQTGANNALSLDFNGTNQRVFIPDNPLFQLTHSLTLEASIYLRSQPVYGGPLIFRGDDRPGCDPYGLFINPDTFGVWICNADNQPVFAESHYSLSLNTWHHFAGTLDDATGQLAFYLDGALVSSTITAIRPFAQLDPNYAPGLGIGNVQSDNYNEYLNGLIDEVRISDQALTPDQFLNAVPEPSTLTLIVIAATSLIGFGWRRRTS